jgi:virginiamycin B lyase
MPTIKALVGAASALLFAACSANAVRSTPDVPSAPAVHAAKAVRFLHEFTLPLGAYPSSIVAGSDGAMWFGTYPYLTNHPPRDLGVARITLRGKQHYYQFGKGVYDVAEGADGRVWFTNPYTYSTYTVGAIATNGAVTQYPVPGAGLPESIAADASKHLWYTAFGGSPDIVEIDTSGKIVATFKLKAGSADKVTYGASGRIWFNAVGSPIVVGRITLRGRQRYGPIGGPSYIPGPMALGSDGRSWICDGDMLAAVDSSLKVRLYTLPSGGNFAGVTAGPDGDLWATDFTNSAIVRVTTGGSMTEYPTPTPNMIPFAIAVGPDHDIWFTEIQRNTDVSKIGVLKP